MWMIFQHFDAEMYFPTSINSSIHSLLWWSRSTPSTPLQWILPLSVMGVQQPPPPILWPSTTPSTYACNFNGSSHFCYGGQAATTYLCGSTHLCYGVWSRVTPSTQHQWSRHGSQAATTSVDPHTFVMVAKDHTHQHTTSMEQPLLLWWSGSHHFCGSKHFCYDVWSRVTHSIQLQWIQPLLLWWSSSHTSVDLQTFVKNNTQHRIQPPCHF